MSDPSLSLPLYIGSKRADNREMTAKDSQLDLAIVGKDRGFGGNTRFYRKRTTSFQQLFLEVIRTRTC